MSIHINVYRVRVALSVYRFRLLAGLEINHVSIPVKSTSFSFFFQSLKTGSGDHAAIYLMEKLSSEINGHNLSLPLKLIRYRD